MGLDSVGRILAESIPGRVDRTRRAIWQSRGECNPSSWLPNQPRVNNRARGYESQDRDAHAMPRITMSCSTAQILRLAPHSKTPNTSRSFSPVPFSLSLVLFLSPSYGAPVSFILFSHTITTRGVRAAARFALSAPPHGNQEGAISDQECD